MRWFVHVPCSSSLDMNRCFTVIMLMSFLTSVHCLSKSLCSPYLTVRSIDVRTTNEYVQPCPVSSPCQCQCETETKRLWIDCFHRQLTQLPILETIPSNNTQIEWNIDLAFNLLGNVSDVRQLPWIPRNMYLRHLIFSSSLAYDLIVQLNLTHRHLIDRWPNHEHLLLTDDDAEQTELVAREDKHTRLLAELTLHLRESSEQIQDFTLSISATVILYLDHNLLDAVPVRALHNATALYELYLSFNHLVQLPAYAFGFSHRLTRLDLSHNQISSIDNCTFQRHPDAFAGPFLIDYLDLSYNHLTHLQSDLFSYLVNLRLLKLQHNQLRSLSASLWTGLYRLKYLDLSHNHLTNFTQAFYNSYLNELNHLKISSNDITTLDQCEFMAMKSLNKLDLSGNQLTHLETCSFYGLSRSEGQTTLHVHLRSNQLESLHPCSFSGFARSSIHVENNPLVCNCSFNYLLQDRKSLAYTGQECRGGYAYGHHQQYAQPAVRKSHRISSKKLTNASNPCRNVFKYYNHLCSKSDCASLCSPNERLIIQITTITTPSRTATFADSTLVVFLCMVIHCSRLFSLCDMESTSA